MPPRQIDTRVTRTEHERAIAAAVETRDDAVRFLLNCVYLIHDNPNLLTTDAVFRLFREKHPLLYEQWKANQQLTKGDAR